MPHELAENLDRWGNSPAYSPFDMDRHFDSEEEEEVFSGSQMIASNPNASVFYWEGGHYMALKDKKGHTLVIGLPGAGKTILMNPSIAHAICTLRKGIGTVIIFDPKGDRLPSAHALAKQRGVPLYYFNLSDPRSHVLDIQKEVDGRPDRLREVSVAVIPEPTGGGEPIWSGSSQAIVDMTGMVKISSGERWGFHTLYNATLQSVPDLLEYLKLYAPNSDMAERLLGSKSEKTTASIMMTLSSYLQPLKMAATHQYHTPPERWIDLRTILHQGGVVVIGQDPTTRAISTPIQRMMFKFISDIIQQMPDYSPGHRFIFIDELPYLAVGGNLPGLIDLFNVGRSKNCHIYAICQSFDQLVKAYGREGAEIIAGDCSTQIFFRAGTESTAAWMSRQTGTFRSWDTSYGISESGLSSTLSPKERARINPTTFLDLSDADPHYGVDFVIRSPKTGNRIMYLSPEEISRLQPPISDIPTFVEKPYHQLFMPTWNPLEEIARTKVDIGKHRAEYMASSINALDREIREIVWKSFNYSIDKAIADLN